MKILGLLFWPLRLSFSFWLCDIYIYISPFVLPSTVPFAPTVITLSPRLT